MTQTTLSVSKELSRAQSALRSGQRDKAAKHFNAVLARFPANKRARDGLARLALANPKAKAISAEDVQRCISLFRACRYDASLALVDQLSRVTADHPALMDLRAANLRALGKIELALEQYEQALALQPQNTSWLLNCAAVLSDLTRFSEAEPLLEKALALSPELTEASVALGKCRVNMGHISNALTCVDAGLSLRPDHAGLLNLRGIILRDLNRLDEARACHLGVAGSPNDRAEAQNNLGILATATGHFDTAATHYREALKLNQKLTLAHRNLSRVTKYTPDHPHLAQMLALADRPIPPADEAQIRFGLFKALNDIGDHRNAFDNLERANALRKVQIDYRIEKDEALFQHLIQLFPEPATLANGDRGLQPIFIVGLPRSGTTLAEQVLSACDGVHGAGELPVVNLAVGKCLRRLQHDGNRGLTHNDITDLRAEILQGLRNYSNDAPVVIDKMPLNFRWIGLILAALPEARIVHTTRSAFDNCWSLFKVCFASAGNGFAYDQHDVARFHALHDQLMAHWHGLFPNQIFQLHHQELVSDTENTTRLLAEFCGLDWSPDCLTPERVNRPVFTASATQIRSPIHGKATPDWTPYSEWLMPMKDALRV